KGGNCWKKIYRFGKSMLVCKSFALVMRVNFPAAVALWLHFSSSATVCAPPSALTARSAPLRSPERIDRDSADPTIARPGTRSPPTVHDFRLSLSDAVYE
ncbi:hypothetical protein ALC56_12761, partial [Trachymyrmex septentrionalis]